MRFLRRSAISATLVLVSAVSLPAQILQAAMRTSGLSCGFCTGLSEYQFRHIPGVDKVEISLSKEIIVISYDKSNGPFNPEAIRRVLKPWNVKVLQFQVRARGRMYQHGGTQFFRTGSDTFAIRSVKNGSAVPTDMLVEIEGILNDRVNPKELKVMTFKPIAP